VDSKLDLRHLITGGTGSRSHVPEFPEEMPDRLEAGTPNTPGLVSLTYGLHFLREEGPERICSRTAERTRRMESRLREMENVDVLNPDSDSGDRTPVVSYRLTGVDPEEAAYHYDERHGIAVRAGLHCAPWAHRWLGTLDRVPPGCLRASPGYFPQPDEISTFLDATADLIETLS